MKKCTSSTLDEIDYDPTTRRLTIRFKGGGTYEYSDVSQKEYDAFEKAESLGGHFHTHIKGKFDFNKIEKKREQK